jgi:hypothetical protein
VSESFCGFAAQLRGYGISSNDFVCRPGGAWFFGGVDPQLKLRAIFGCSFGAKKACQNLDGKINSQA